MGFRSTFVSQCYGISWPDWFQNKYKNVIHFNNGVGVIADRILIDDVLYGLGVALGGEKYKWANGYESFKEELVKHLTKSTNKP